MPVGIIDIGSNAIRAAIFDSNKLCANQIYSSKFGTNIQNLIILDNYDVPHQFYMILNHFISIFEKNDIAPQDVNCIATEVLRRSDNTKFCDFVKQKYNIKIKVLSGDEEATLSALGVLSNIPDAKGVVADLGGGSLEISEISNRVVGKRCSLPLGVKVNTNKDAATVDSLREEILNSFKMNLQTDCYENLYFASGVLRDLARNYQMWIDYPLKNLHRFEILTEDFIEYLKSIILDELNAEVDLYVVKLSIALIQATEPKNIVISVYGLKDGLRFSRLDESEKSKNIAMEKAKLVTGFNQNIDFVKYRHFINSISSNNFSDLVLESMEFTLMFLSIKFIPDSNLRSFFLTQLIFSSDISFSHKQKTMIALMVNVSFKGHATLNLVSISRVILSKSEYEDSIIIGKMLCVLLSINGNISKEPYVSIVKDQYKKPILKTSSLLPYEIFDKCKLLLRQIQKIQGNK